MPDAQGLKHAAVCLIVADDGAGAAALVLTRRAEHLSAHSGQFALPGGRIDAGETATEAALREAREEIGLELAPASILGRLDDYPTRSGYVITPLVAWAPRKAQMRANPGEVAAIHRVNLAELGQPGSPEIFAIPESDRPVIRYPLLGHHDPRADRGAAVPVHGGRRARPPYPRGALRPAGLGAALAQASVIQ